MSLRPLISCPSALKPRVPFVGPAVYPLRVSLGALLESGSSREDQSECAAVIMEQEIPVSLLLVAGTQITPMYLDCCNAIKQRTQVGSSLV